MSVQTSVLRFAILSAAFVALAAAAPASAQYWGPGVPPPDYSGRIPPQHIEAMVRSMGFQPVAEPRVRGPLWVTHAVDRNGQQVRVLIDGFSGRVIDVLRRPLPPQRVAVVPPPSANGPFSDYEDEGPDYDYGDMPRQRPADWPPSRPQVQQGPNIVPLDRRGENKRTPDAPKSSTAKKKETKKNNETTAALRPDKEKEKAPAPQARPADAPKADAPKKDAPKAGTPKSAEVPTFVPNPDQLKRTDAAAPPAQSLEMKKSEPPTALPPVQPPF